MEMVKRFIAATTSKDFGLQSFYFAFACLLYSIWRAVDLLVQVQLTGEYEHSPIVTWVEYCWSVFRSSWKSQHVKRRPSGP